MLRVIMNVIFITNSYYSLYKITCGLVEIHAQMHSFPMKFIYFLHVHIQWWHWHSVPTQTWFCASGCGLLFRQCGKGGGGRELCRATSGPAKFWIIHRCNITSCIIAQMLGLVTNMVMSVWASVSLFTTWPYLTKKMLSPHMTKGIWSDGPVRSHVGL